MAEIIISDTFGKTEEFKRPDHPDFMSSSELAQMRWSGIRHNSLIDKLEIWYDGVVKGEFGKHEQERLEKAFAEIFGLHIVKTEKGAN